jgi:hypothetical protein
MADDGRETTWDKRMNIEAASGRELRGRVLALARAAWLVIAVFYIGAFVVTVPLLLNETPDFTSTTQGVTHAEFLAGLEQMGVASDSYIVFQQWASVALRLMYLALAVFLFWRKSADGMAILTSLLFLMFLGPFDTLAQLNPLWLTVGEISALISTMLLILWFFVFPDGRFVPRRMRWLYLLVMTTQVWRILQPEAYQQSFALLVPVIFGGILIAQVFCYRHAGVAQRQQIKWVVFGIVAGTLPLVLFGLYASAVLSNQPPLAQAIGVSFWGGWLWYFFLFILPVSLTFAILRSRLFDIDVIIRKTLVYSVLTALLAMIYFGGVVLVQQLTRSITSSSDLAIVVSTLVIAALFFPLQRRVQNAIDRRFYRRKYDAQKVLEQFAATVRDEVELDKLTAELINVVNETMQPKSVSVWLRDLNWKE